MKTKFAKVKSEYAHLIRDLIGTKLNMIERHNAKGRLKQLEDKIKTQGDELIFIVTTRDTNPMKEKTAPPMSAKDIKNS